MLTPAAKSAQVAAGILCAGLAAIALRQLAGAAGATRGLDEAFGGEVSGWSVGVSVASLAVAALCAAAVSVTAARMGWRETRLSDHALQICGWIIFVTLPRAIAALVVARAHPWGRARRAPRPPATPTPPIGP